MTIFAREKIILEEMLNNVQVILLAICFVLRLIIFPILFYFSEHVEIFQQLSSPSFFDSALEKYFIYEPVNECQGFEIHLCCLR